MSLQIWAPNVCKQKIFSTFFNCVANNFMLHLSIGGILIHTISHSITFVQQEHVYHSVESSQGNQSQYLDSIFYLFQNKRCFPDLFFFALTTRQSFPILVFHPAHCTCITTGYARQLQNENTFQGSSSSMLCIVYCSKGVKSIWFISSCNHILTRNQYVKKNTGIRDYLFFYFVVHKCSLRLWSMKHSFG